MRAILFLSALAVPILALCVWMVIDDVQMELHIRRVRDDILKNL